jgi:hypothetical protein
LSIKDKERHIMGINVQVKSCTPASDDMTFAADIVCMKRDSIPFFPLAMFGFIAADQHNAARKNISSIAVKPYFLTDQLKLYPFLSINPLAMAEACFARENAQMKHLGKVPSAWQRQGRDDRAFHEHPAKTYMIEIG